MGSKEDFEESDCGAAEEIQTPVIGLEVRGPIIGRRPQIWCRMLGLNQLPLAYIVSN